MWEWTPLPAAKANPIPALVKLVLAPVLFSTVLLISTSDHCFGPRSPQILLTQKRELAAGQWHRVWHAACCATGARSPSHRLSGSNARRSQNIGVLELRAQPPRSPDLLEQSVWAPIGLQIICLPAFRSRSGLETFVLPVHSIRSISWSRS